MFYFIILTALVILIIVGVVKARKGKMGDTLTNVVATPSVNGFETPTLDAHRATKLYAAYNKKVKEYNDLLLKYKLSKSAIAKEALAQRLLAKQVALAQAEQLLKDVI